MSYGPKKPCAICGTRLKPADLGEHENKCFNKIQSKVELDRESQKKSNEKNEKDETSAPDKSSNDNKTSIEKNKKFSDAETQSTSGLSKSSTSDKKKSTKIPIKYIKSNGGNQSESSESNKKSAKDISGNSETVKLVTPKEVNKQKSETYGESINGNNISADKNKKFSDAGTLSSHGLSKPSKTDKKETIKVPIKYVKPNSDDQSESSNSSGKDISGSTETTKLVTPEEVKRHTSEMYDNKSKSEEKAAPLKAKIASNENKDNKAPNSKMENKEVKSQDSKKAARISDLHGGIEDSSGHQKNDKTDSQKNNDTKHKKESSETLENQDDKSKENEDIISKPDEKKILESTPYPELNAKQNNSSNAEKLPGSGSYTNELPELNDANEAAYQSHLKNLVPCAHCGRRFNPDRVMVHEGACIERPRKRQYITPDKTK